jgi:ATP-dependent Lon protease
MEQMPTVSSFSKKITNLQKNMNFIKKSAFAFRLNCLAIGWLEHCVFKILTISCPNSLELILQFLFKDDSFVKFEFESPMGKLIKQIFTPVLVRKVVGSRYCTLFEFSPVKPPSNLPSDRLKEICVNVSNKSTSYQLLGVISTDPMETYRKLPVLEQKKREILKLVWPEDRPTSSDKLLDLISTDIQQNFVNEIPLQDLLARDVNSLASQTKRYIERLDHYPFLKTVWNKQVDIISEPKVKISNESSDAEAQPKSDTDADSQPKSGVDADSQAKINKTDRKPRSTSIEIKSDNIPTLRQLINEFKFMLSDEKLWMIGHMFALGREPVVTSLLMAIDRDFVTIRALAELLTSRHYLLLSKKTGFIIPVLQAIVGSEQTPKIAQNANTPTPEQDSLHDRVKKMVGPEKAKKKANEMWNSIQRANDGAPKASQYLETLLRIPFNKHFNEIESFLLPDAKSVSDITPELAKKRRDYIQSVDNSLNEAVHGHTRAKKQISRLLAQWITGGLSGAVVGIQGPPGNGKTTLIKNGLAKCLCDPVTKKERPVGYIALGGSSHGSILEGHGYTYQGSKCGRIVDILVDSECMNPILLFDELDKVSSSASGREIIGILTHLTDPSQNKEFNDRYFDGIPIDLSKAIIVFTFNDLGAIDPILRDRLTLIETKPLTDNDKIAVTRKHILPELCVEIGLANDQVVISDETILWLIDTFTAEAGARQLRRLLVELIQEWNLDRLSNQEFDAKLEIDLETAQKTLHYLAKRRPSVVGESDITGQINGMYCNALGMGGILPIQVACGHSYSNGLELTGQQGDVMKESMSCARTIAMKLANELNPDDLTQVGRDRIEKVRNNKMGFHIHCPSTAMPKDGPSAGGAITIALFSQLINKPINRTIAMTGEIDLSGAITAIGGLGPKLKGAKAAGIKIALYPKENEQDMEKLRKEGESPEDETFQAKAVATISEALEYFTF